MFPPLSAPAQYSLHISGRQTNSSHLYVLNSLGCSACPPQLQHTACHHEGSNPGTRPPAEVRPAGAGSPDRMKGNSLLDQEQLRQRTLAQLLPSPSPCIQECRAPQLCHAMACTRVDTDKSTIIYFSTLTTWALWKWLLFLSCSPNLWHGKGN